MTGLLVAFQGEAGAYSEEGVRSLFPDAERRPLAGDGSLDRPEIQGIEFA